jgi:hypothetical protein
MKIFLTGSSLVIALGVLWGASIPFAYECSRESGFVMDPNAHKRVGYVTEFGSNGVAMQKDLQVMVPFKATHLQINAPATANGFPTAKVVGVIENFQWGGGVGDALSFDFYASKENAMAIKALQQSNLTTTKVDKLGWWICDYDQEQKTWYEQSYPQSVSAITGIFGPKTSPELNVDLSGVPVKDGIDVMVYKVHMQIAPGANQAFQLMFANAAGKSMTKSWGLTVGTLAPGALGK